MSFSKLVSLEALDSFARMLKTNIKEDLLDNKKIKYLTQQEYEELSDSNKEDDTIVYNIIDAEDDHNHNDMYYTKEDIDFLLGNYDGDIGSNSFIQFATDDDITAIVNKILTTPNESE